MSESADNEKSPEDDDQELDPRVKEELERLNHANEAINHLELQLDEARKTMKEFWISAEDELSQLEKSIGTSVNKAREYYDARVKLLEAKNILIKAKHRFERAQALHVAAKELAVVSADLIDEAEKSNQNPSDWNETYDQALVKAADAEREKYQADLEQQTAEENYSELDKSVQKLQKDLRRAINKSQPYYEKKAELFKELDFHKAKVEGLENCVMEAKFQYSETLQHLEQISNEIHEQRRKRHETSSSAKLVEEEQLSYTSFNPFPSTTKDSSPSKSSIPRLNRHSQLLRSCLLQTEALPAGIFAAPNSERKSDVNDISAPVNVTDLFLIPTKEMSKPPPIVIIDSTRNQNQKKNRSADHSPHLTDDEDEKNPTVHVLSDEQIEHFGSNSRHENNRISDSLFQSLSKLLQPS